MRPIPKSLLIDTIKHTTGHVYTNGHSTPTGGEDTIIKHVRVHFLTSQSIKNYGLESTDKAIVWIDVRNSSPRNIVVKKGDRIEYLGDNAEHIGDKFEVRQAEPNYTIKLHHTELILK